MNGRGQPTPLRACAEGVAQTDRLFAAKTAALYRIAPTGILGAWIAAVVLAAVLTKFGGVPVVVLAAWQIAVIAVAGGHLLLCGAYRRARPAIEDWRLRRDGLC